RVLVAWLAGTGMRVGEDLALEVSDVQGSVLRVRQSLYQRRLDTTKTEAGEREIDLAPELAEMIQAHVALWVCLQYKQGRSTHSEKRPSDAAQHSEAS